MFDDGSLGTRQSPRSSRQHRVLIVDDHAKMRGELRGLFGYSRAFVVIGEAPDGEQAVQLADQLQPDFVLMDVKMPRMDGIEATRLIKEHQPEVIVIGVSAELSDQVEASMRAAGAAALLPKENLCEHLYFAVAARFN